nr:hypothetical protein [Tanacetum cinerariifolium]
MINNEDTVEIVDDMDEFVSSNNKIGSENLNNGDDIQVTTTPRHSQMMPKNKKKVNEERDFTSKIKSSFEHVADAMKECTKSVGAYGC